MKKRNSPILLVTALVLLFCVAAFVSLKAQRTASGQEMLPQSSEEPLTAKRDTGDKASMAGAVQAAVGAKPANKQLSMVDEDSPSLIHRSTMRDYKPVPSDGTISGQWYTSEGMKDYKKKGN